MTEITETYGTEEQATRDGKQDEYSKAVGGFMVARMSGGGFDFFPVGMPAHTDGNVDHEAVKVSAWSYTGKWREVFTQADEIDF